jgi:hypothetical protein
MSMSDKKYTPDELRAHIMKMHPKVGYKDQPTTDEWALQVGIGAGMLSVAADRIEELETLVAAHLPGGEFSPSVCRAMSRFWARVAEHAEATLDRTGEHK